MQYLTELNAFYDWLETNDLDASCIALWHAIMQTANRAGWPETFAVASSVLSVKAGLNRDAFFRARNRLVQLGRITCTSRKGRQSAVYSLIPFASDIATQSATQRATQHATQSATQRATIKERLDKTRLDKTKKEKGQKEKSGAPAPTPIPFQSVVDMYNSVCHKLPRCTVLSEARKKAIKARLASGYALEDFQKLFSKAANSSFLQGGNSRNWQANFDWLLKDANMAKVLDGNYDGQAVRFKQNNNKPATGRDAVDELLAEMEAIDI